MKHLLTTLAKLMEEQELPGLLIGGHAVTILGYPRATFDVDLLIPRSSSEGWKKHLSSICYEIFAENSNFLQFESIPDLPLPAIDLMIVADDVYRVLEADLNQCEPIPTPSATALIALKLHAINQPQREQIEKDWLDIFGIVDAWGLNLDDSEFSAIVKRHGGIEALERISDHLSR